MLIGSVSAATAQTGGDELVEKENLPFALADEKRLTDEDLKEKKEGAYVTALPLFSSDPLNGFGYGVEGSLFFNGSRKNAFFPYTPYLHRIDLLLFNTTNEQREFAIKHDAPFIFGSKWRLRSEAAYEVNPNLLYFGNTTASLRSLSYYPNGDVSAQPVSNATYSDYENSLKGPNERYHGYKKEEAKADVRLEHSFFGGRVRLLGGYELMSVRMSTYDGNSLLQNDVASGAISGIGRNTIAIAKFGAAYDTRDLETDPNKGVFAEITNEVSNGFLGSAFNFNKTLLHIKHYYPLFPQTFSKFILATRFGMGYTAGAAPFFEYLDQWSSEGSIDALGGPSTLRGYKQGRFAARLMDFASVELRFRFAQTRIWDQHLAFSFAPFFDIGGAWDNFSQLNLRNYRYSTGLGLRIAWNVNTILRFDYAYSPEDNQFFFNFGHTF